MRGNGRLQRYHREARTVYSQPLRLTYFADLYNKFFTAMGLVSLGALIGQNQLSSQGALLKEVSLAGDSSLRSEYAFLYVCHLRICIQRGRRAS